MRRDQPDAERYLWSRLRAGRLLGIKFRRQQPIGDYIVDFVCFGHMLVIEVDGGQHNEPAAIARDSERTLDLERRGYRVVRFWDNEVLTNIDGVVSKIIDALGVVGDRKSPSP